MRKNIFITAVFIVTAGIIAMLFFAPSFFFHPQVKTIKRTRVVIPREISGEGGGETNALELMAHEDAMTAKVPLLEGESLVAVFTYDFDGDQREEQILAYRNLLEAGSPVAIAYLAFDPRTGEYRRMWSAPTMAERPGTVNLYSQDMIGDRSACILVSGMTAAGEHTLTVFRKNETAASGPDSPFFTKIAEIRIDGSIAVRETERTQAYQRGLAPGQSFTIIARGRNMESSNILDQIEITYVYNPVPGRYEQGAIVRVPGAQIEQLRVRELLGGKRGVFENFIAGLWYYTGPQTLDNRQYIYFDPVNRELIFYIDEIQQVFHWQNSSATRYGLYIASQNISVTTLRRFLDIELESLDSLKIRVFEDVRLKINVSDSWDGSYRKAGVRMGEGPMEEPVPPFLDGVYDGAIGKIHFFKDGAYELYAEGTSLRGKYTFFRLEGRELLELRPGPVNGLTRETYLVDRTVPKTASGAGENAAPRAELILLRVRIGTRGIEEVREAAISLAPAED